MSITTEHVAEIKRQIDVNHTFDPSQSIRFETDETEGYIPRTHLETYLATELFTFDEVTETLRFADHINDAELKSGAIKHARECLIKDGLFDPKYVPKPQFRAVGGESRLMKGQEEFTIDRNEYRLLGFPSDAVFLNVIIDNDKGEPKILLQKRADNGKWDFAAGGAVKYPQNVQEALGAQIREEIGVSVSGIEPLGTANFRFSNTQKSWVTSQTHNLFQVQKPLMEIGDFDKLEVEGFGTFTPEEAIELCGSGEFQDQNIQGFMTALFAAGLVPDNIPGMDEVEATLHQHYGEPVSDPQALSFGHDADYSNQA